MKLALLCLTALWCMGIAQAANTNRIFETSVPVTNVQKIAWDDVPDAAQRTLRSQSDGGEMTAVGKATLRGTPVYIGSFPSDGNIMEVVVKPDGSLVAAESSPDYSQIAAAGAQAPAATNGSVAVTGTNQPAGPDVVATTEPAPAPALPGNAPGAAAPGQKLTWSDLPEAVQTGFRTQTDSARIQDITVGQVDGKVVYDIRYRNGGENSVSRVSATGEILTREIITESAGAPLAPQPMTFEQLPLNVQSTVNAAAPQLPILGIEQNILDGRTIYGITVLQDGQPVQIRVTGEGQVVP